MVLWVCECVALGDFESLTISFVAARTLLNTMIDTMMETTVSTPPTIVPASERFLLALLPPCLLMFTIAMIDTIRPMSGNRIARMRPTIAIVLSVGPCGGY